MRVLIVDDDVGILELLAAALAPRHEVKPAESGEAALALARETPPDLVIVDVGLPGMDGLELTRRLREHFSDGQYLPVVAITGRDEGATRERAYEVGCDDVLAKPFSMREVRARVESLLARRQAHHELRTLSKLKEDLAALVVHDLRNPLSALRMNLEMLVPEVADADPVVRETLGDCLALTQRALTLVGGLLDVTELEGGLLRPTPVEVGMAAFLPRLWTSHQVDVRLKRLEISLEVTPPELRGSFDPDLVGRVVENLLDNAVRYAPEGGHVRVSAARDGDLLLLAVGNDGPAVPADERERVFDKFHRIDERRAGARANRGLGLYFCRLVAEAHGGRIEVGGSAAWPCVFTLVLPQPSSKN